LAKPVRLFQFTNQKNKTLRLNYIIFLIILFVNFSFSQSNDIPEKWKNSGSALFLVNQSSFSNWTSGGQSSISGTLKIDYNFNYADNGWSWDTKLISNFGLNKISGSEFLKKTDDKLEINSVLGKKFNNDVIGNWSYSSFFNFQTQFAKGYRFGKDTNGNPNRTEKSRFFSPATVQLGVGLYWKKNKNLWVNVAPMTGKLILVNRKFTENLSDNQTYFGVRKGSNSRFELGASVRSYYKKELFQNITMENRLSLYSDYLDRPQNIDIDCTFNFVMKVNQYVSTNLIFQFVYDDNEIKRVQIREVLGIGLNIDLSKIRI